jgi:hypothetical protein
MGESSEVILYDIPSSDPCRAWSPNTWKSTYLPITYIHINTNLDSSTHSQLQEDPLYNPLD